MKKLLRMVIFMGLGILAIAAIACGSDDAPTASGSQNSAVSDAPTLRESVKDIILKSYLTNPDISGVTISQDGSSLSLLMIVNCATSEDAARAMGERFVRLVKQWGPDPDPTTAEIGTGEYNYSEESLARTGPQSQRGLRPAAAPRSLGNTYLKPSYASLKPAR